MRLFFALLASAASLFAQIQVIPSTERISVSLPKINTNFAWLNANKAPLAHVHLVADITGFTAAVRAAHSATGPIVYDPATGIISCPQCGTSTGVPSVFGRTGNVVAQFTDYSAYFAALLHSHALADVTGLVAALAGKEPALGNPATDGRILSSTAAGVRSWIVPSAGGAGTAPYSCTVSGVSSIACTHNLGTSTPWVACYDTAHNLLGSTGATTSVTSVVATSANVATLTFSGSTTGLCLISTGSMGPIGPTGATGSQGIQGATGGQGIQGIQGIQGPIGNTGAAGTGSGDTSSNTSTSVDNEVVLFSGTNGKVLKRATGDGYLKVAAGVMGTPATIPLADLPAAAKVRPCEIAVGDPGAASPVLADDNDSPGVCGNLTGASLTISTVSCTYYPAGGTAPTISPVITGGAALLTAPLACGSAGTFTVGTLSITTQTNGQSIDANITVAGGTAKYIVIRFGRTL